MKASSNGDDLIRRSDLLTLIDHATQSAPEHMAQAARILERFIQHCPTADERADARIIIDDVPPSLNKFAGRANVWEYRKLKQQWTEMVRLLGIPQQPSTPFERACVHIHYTFPDRRRHDPDNYTGKLIMDGLTAAGIIADDSFSHIELTLTAEARRGVKKTEITIEEIHHD